MKQSINLKAQKKKERRKRKEKRKKRKKTQRADGIPGKQIVR